MTQRMVLILAFLLAVSGWAAAAPGPWPGPWDPATEAAAELAVAQLGAKRGLDVRATVLDVQATVLDVQATVLETPRQREVVAGAKPDVGSKPPDDKGPQLGVASGPHSTMASDVLYLPAHPDAVATLTIRVADQQGQPLPGKRVQVASALSGGPADTIIQPEAPTDARGFTTARVRPTIPPHTARFSARVLEDNVDIGQVVEIEVQAPGPPSFFPPAFAPYFDEKHFVVSPTPLKVGQPTTITVSLTNVRKVPVEVRVRFFSNVLNIGLGNWPQIGETDTFVLQPGESRDAKITWIPTVESGHQCIQVQVWGRELPPRTTTAPWGEGLPFVRTASAQTPAPSPTAATPALMDSRQQNVGPVTPRKKKCDDGELCAQLGAAVKAVKKGIQAKRDKGKAAVKAPFKSNAVKALQNGQQNACTDAALAAAINAMLKSLANLKEKPVNTAEVVENNHLLKEIKDKLRTMIEAKCAVRPPDAAPCPVAPLAPLSAAAQQEEKHPHDEAKLTDDMKKALACLRGKWKRAGHGNISVTSAYRSTEYQRHLYNLWKKYVVLLATRNPACDALLAEVEAEMKKHGVIGAPLNPDSPTASQAQHPKGAAIDVQIPKENPEEFLASAACCNLYRPWPNDPVHFEVCPPERNCMENCVND